MMAEISHELHIEYGLKKDQAIRDEIGVRDRKGREQEQESQEN